MQALSLRGLKRFEESLTANLRSHQLAPDNVETLNNVADSLQALGRYEEAVKWFDRAIGLRPNFILAFINKGSALVQLGRLDEAIDAWREVNRLDPGNAEADWNLSLLELLIGDFEAGWPRPRDALEQQTLSRCLSEIFRTDVARQGGCRRQDNPCPCRRRVGRYDSVRTLRADAGRA